MDRQSSNRGWRRWVALAIAVLGVMVVGRRLSSEWPRTVHVQYEVESGATAFDVDYLQDGEAMLSARFHVDPAEDVIAHTAKLPPGEYEVHGVTTRAGRTSAEPVVRKLVVPAEGAIRIDFRQ